MDLKNMIGKVYRFQMTGVGKFPFEILSKYQIAPETKLDLQVMFQETQKRRSVNLASIIKPSEKELKKFGWDINMVYDPSLLKDDYNLYHTWPC